MQEFRAFILSYIEKFLIENEKSIKLIPVLSPSNKDVVFFYKEEEDVFKNENHYKLYRIMLFQIGNRFCTLVVNSNKLVFKILDIPLTKIHKFLLQNFTGEDNNETNI